MRVSSMPNEYDPISSDLFAKMLANDITQANAGVTHADFVAGVRSGSLGFKYMFGEPHRLVMGGRKAIFNVLVLLYMIAPPVLISTWALYEHNWWLLLGILVSYAASYSAAIGSKIIFLLHCICIGAWVKSGFSIHQHITFFFFCSLWGYMLFKMAESAQNEYALQSLLEKPDLFEKVVAGNLIMIVRRGEAKPGA
jgi:hypothetical protein